MAKKIFDSNIWIAFFAESDPTHKQAVKIINNLTDDEELFITELIISEIATVLKIRYSQDAMRIFLDHVYNSANIRIISLSEYFHQTIDLAKELNDKKLSFTDMTLLFLSEKYQIETFDKNLKKKIRSK